MDFFTVKKVFLVNFMSTIPIGMLFMSSVVFLYVWVIFTVKSVFGILLCHFFFQLESYFYVNNCQNKILRGK